MVGVKNFNVGFESYWPQMALANQNIRFCFTKIGDKTICLIRAKTYDLWSEIVAGEIGRLKRLDFSV